MEFLIADDYAAMSHATADRIAAVLAAKPDANIMVPTGATPLGLYQELRERTARGEIDWSKVRVFQLDEYLGAAPDDERSFYQWTKRMFFDPVGIKAEQVVQLPGDAENIDAVCRAYDDAVQAAGGIDLAVLGLGPNGHIGFNDPPAAADAPTRVAPLTESSIQGSASTWGGYEHTPRYAVTSGMNVLLAAREIVLMVSGEHKRDILRQTISGAIGPEVPASYLRTADHVLVIADRAAWGDGAQAS